MYHYVASKKNLIEENRELKLELNELKKNRPFDDMDKKQMSELILANSKLRDGLKEAKINEEYYERLYETEKEDKERRIRKCYDWIRSHNIKANWDEFSEWVMSD